MRAVTCDDLICILAELFQGCSDNNYGNDPDSSRAQFGEIFFNHSELLNGTQKRIVVLLKENSKLTAELLVRKLGISSRIVEYNIKKIKELGIVVDRGLFRDGYWQINI